MFAITSQTSQPLLEEVTLRTVQYSTGSTAIVYFLPSDPTATHLIQPD